MWRVVNFRCFLLVALSCIIMVSLSLLETSVFIIILSILSALILGAGVFALIKKDGIKAITALLCIVCMVVIAINTLVTQNAWVNELDEQTEYTFTGKIERIDKDLENCNYILTDLTADGKEIDGNIYLTVNVIDGVQTSFLRAGDVVCFKSNADFVPFVKKGEVNGYNYRNNIRYFCSTNENTITFVCEKPTLMQSLRNTLRTLLTENMGEYGEIAFAMITGEKGGISDKITDAYSTGGIGHILAVSGLHVGFVVLIVSWILRKLKANRFVTFGVTSVILLWYCFLASFSPSVVRATVMCIIGLVAGVFGERKDPLSSLSFAVSVILVVKPYYLFDAGFLMSVGAVLGIVLFYSSFNHVFHFLPKFINEPLSVSLSAQIGITPVMLMSFSSFAPYSVLTNLLVIPIVTFAYILIALVLIFVLIFPSCGVLLSISGLPLVVIDDIANFVASLPFANVFVRAGVIAYAIYLLMFVCSKFFMVKRGKWIISVVCVLLSISVIIVNNIPLNRNYSFIACGGYKDVTSVIRTDSGVVVVGDVKNAYKINEVMDKTRENKLDAVFVHSLTEENAKQIIKLNRSYPITAVYCAEGSDISGIHNLIQANVPFYLVHQFSPKTYNITTVYDNGTFVGYSFSDGKANVLMLGYGKKTCDLSEEIVNKHQLIRSYVYNGDYHERIYLVNYENSYLDESPKSLLAQSENYVTIDLKNGKIFHLTDSLFD